MYVCVYDHYHVLHATAVDTPAVLDVSDKANTVMIC